MNEAENSIKGTVTEGVIHWFMTSRRSIRMVSPYFVPSDSAVASLVGARKEGIDVALLTNSLASTDEPWVYVGYWAHIKDLLKSGVQVHEISPSLSVKRRKLGIFGHRTGALHMKSAIVDSKEVFLGSMNLDQRSAKLNTELGLIIESEEMARQLESFADAGSVLCTAPGCERPEHRMGGRRRRRKADGLRRAARDHGLAALQAAPAGAVHSREGALGRRAQRGAAGRSRRRRTVSSFTS
jgi:phosphatidylserine/phosphatidylglycerophosphate/cardiolipin synthase-like enzyme